MGVLVYAEQAKGKFKKAVFEAASVGRAMAGADVAAVVIGSVADGEIEKLGTYGVGTVYHVSGMDLFSDRGYAGAIAAAADKAGAEVVIMAQTYNGKSVSPRLAIKMDAALFSGVTSVPASAGSGYTAVKSTNSGKGIETIATDSGKLIVTVQANAVGLTENPTTASVEALDFADAGNGAVTKEVVKATSKISITEADTVISGGRGWKSPDNWGPLEQLAELLEAGTACSKPVSDMDWRPHHEHVGQTGIQIAPNLYVAIGISGAIQHLAGVNASKHIVVVNKDPEAPFFKVADYGIVGDLFEVVPRLIDAVKEVKAQ